MRRLLALALALSLALVPSAWAGEWGFGTNGSLPGKANVNIRPGGCNYLVIWVDSAEDLYVDLRGENLDKTDRTINGGVPIILKGSTNVADARHVFEGTFRIVSLFNNNAYIGGNSISWRVACTVKDR